MGNFYVNFSVKGGEPQGIAAALERAGCRAIVTPLQGNFAVVYEEEADRQSTTRILL